MRADRLLTLLLLLQNRGRLTAGQLARELEVSVRTVYRDIEALAASGVPVWADRGPDGGYRLTDGYRTRLTGLTGGEAGSLPLAGMPSAAAELGLGAELATAQLKLRAALPAALNERAGRVAERFHLDATAWFRDADPVPFLATAAAAVWEDRLLRVHYRRWAGEVRRELHPLGLVLKGGIWYLVAAAEDQVRTYRVSRLLAVEVLGPAPARPEGFDLAGHWTAAARRLEAGRYRDEATVRVTPRGLRLLPMLFGAAGAGAAAAAGPPDADGRAEVVLPVESLPVAVGDLLRLGTEAEVLGPPALRAAVAEAVGELARRYR
ncbi:helix-turn-helix transcriptional regulator [Streptomyces johnsoniae]|uniref:WYL domain-containing protein n=1 Tax=Streptomyces johnsoniae TaxID=3075532 RepID=A0ABU2S0T1_9ACTN|nr:WYL domain-containing protein [Streptomyces sp. DSM 41886]MDT0442611.1 WYL domain-containing protein [Streptomyces sp. DSM 41886]